ncbi:MAG: MotA/TolQ/ExbB proton channel family protein [Deltaproteobacteria bacterium]|nr:MotA/TolQ/ExbB proton channel family protein [Deltaproteobacteria bacterium]
MLTVLLAQAANVADKTKDVAEKVAENPAIQEVASKSDMSIMHAVLGSDPLVKFTLLLLIGFSIACWAVIFYKVAQLRKAQQASQSFWHKFSATNNISQIKKSAADNGPMLEIYRTGQEVLGQIKKASPKLTDYHRNVLVQRLSQTKEEEVYKLEQYVNFLATTASVAPFIGLFGTVWGILTAFMAIGKAGSTSLATVGPYIAEALVATAVGLFAAIPAVIAYNFFVNKIKIIRKLIDLFIDDFVIKSEQESA